MVRWIKGTENDEMSEEILALLGTREVKSILISGLTYSRV